MTKNKKIKLGMLTLSTMAGVTIATTAIGFNATNTNGQQADNSLALTKTLSSRISPTTYQTPI